MKRTYILLAVLAFGLCCCKDHKKNVALKTAAKIGDSITVDSTLSSIIPVQDPNGFLWGLQDTTTGKLILKYKYHYIFNFSDDRAPVLFNNKYGFIDRAGKETTSPEYDFVQGFIKGYALVQGNFEKTSYINRDGKELFPLKYYRANGFLPEQKRAIVSTDGGSGLMLDLNDGSIVPIDYSKYSVHAILPEGYCIVGDRDRKLGILDLNGKQIFPPIFDQIGQFHDGRLLVVKNRKYGFMDESANELFYTDYDRVYEYYNGFARIVKNKKAGFINREGKEIVPPIYDWYLESAVFSEGFAPVALNHKFGFVDSTGTPLGPFKYDAVEHFRGGMSKVSKGRYVGYVNLKGEEFIPVVYDRVIMIGTKTALGQKNKTFVLSDLKGNEIATFAWDDISSSFDGSNAYYVRVNEKMGTLDSAFRPVIPARYDFLEFVAPGMIKAIKNNKTGYLDLKGNILIPLHYDGGDNFEYGIAKVYENDKVGLINLAGKEIVHPVYVDIGKFEAGIALVQKKNKYGFIDYSGKEIIPAIYDSVYSEGPALYNLIRVFKKGEAFNLNRLGERVEEENEDG